MLVKQVFFFPLGITALPSRKKGGIMGTVGLSLTTLANRPRPTKDHRMMCHTPIPDPTRLADPNRVRGSRPYTGTLYLFFFFFVFFYKRIKNIIYIYKRTTTEVVSIKFYTHILSPIYIYKIVLLHLQIRAWNLQVVNPY